MEKTDITLTNDQESEILDFLEMIVTKTNTLKALFTSIDAIADPNFVGQQNGIEGIPYLVELAIEVSQSLTAQTDSIFETLKQK